LTHAPIAPWFSTNSTRYPSGAYRTVHKNVGNLIDWYNVQVSTPLLHVDIMDSNQPSSVLQPRQ
jgi:hypothetical protein